MSENEGNKNEDEIEENKFTLLLLTNAEIRHVETLFIRSLTPSLVILSGIYFISKTVTDNKIAVFAASFYILPIVFVSYRLVVRIHKLRSYADKVRNLKSSEFSFSTEKAKLAKILVPTLERNSIDRTEKFPYLNFYRVARFLSLLFILITIFSIAIFNITSDPIIFSLAIVGALCFLFIFFPYDLVETKRSLFNTSEYIVTENFLALFIVTVVLILIFIKLTENYDKFFHF